jgi:hypothetical protein
VLGRGSGKPHHARIAYLISQKSPTGATMCRD